MATDSRSLRILLTGASTGLGLAIAQALLRTEHRVVLTARATSLPRFAEAGIVASGRVYLRPLDVTAERERRAVVEEANRRWGAIDVLINNAGVSYRSVIEHVSEADALGQMAVNFRAPLDLARLVLPGMRRQRWGRILNVSSVGGMMAMPTMGIYSASKFALEGASEALFYEVRPWNIRVSLIEPGFINSEGFEKVHFTALSAPSSDTESDPYHNHYRYMGDFIGRMMRCVPSTPQSVARAVMRTIAARHPPLRVPATLDAQLFSVMRRVLPRRLYHYVLYRCLPGVEHWGPQGHAPRAPQGLRHATLVRGPADPPSCRRSRCCGTVASSRRCSTRCR